MGPPTNGVLCLSTPKHNGKSGTDYDQWRNILIRSVVAEGESISHKIKASKYF